VAELAAGASMRYRAVWLVNNYGQMAGPVRQPEDLAHQRGVVLRIGAIDLVGKGALALAGQGLVAPIRNFWQASIERQGGGPPVSVSYRKARTHRNLTRGVSMQMRMSGVRASTSG
jgi:hypothetical protein